MAESDYESIVATARGDRAAFERLVARYQRPLFNFILRYLGDRPAAEDLTQEVFLRAFEAAGRFEPRASVASWLFKIAYNLAMNEIKRRGRFQSLSDQPVAVEAETADRDYSESSARRELEGEVASALGALTENQRAALLLRVNEGMSYREIGEVMGLSLQSVESLIFRARTRLKQLIER